METNKDCWIWKVAKGKKGYGVVFFDTVWKLHIGEIPEKPKKEDHATYLSYYPELFKYNEAIAAIKQNALPVGNPKLIEKIIPVPIGMSYKKDHFYPFKGGFETKEMQYRVSIIDGKGGYTPVQTVAILTLPEEKKNTMENMTKEHLTEVQKYKVLNRTSFKNVSGNWQFNGDMTPERFIKILFTVLEESGSVAAPKEEGLNIPWDSDYYESRINELKEALKELLPIAENELHQSTCIGYSYTKIKAIIERARNLISK